MKEKGSLELACFRVAQAPQRNTYGTLFDPALPSDAATSTGSVVV